MTSLLWSNIADKYGRRFVLFISLFGSAASCTLFGTSSSLAEAITIRLLQGVFAGAIGVARSSVTFITDPSNEGKAYAILGFCWGLGGVAGAIIGGAFESPSQKWPHIFPSSGIFGRFPYVLPCAIAGGIILLGSILSLFLDYNAGPRSGSIALSTHEDEEGRCLVLRRCLMFPLGLAKGLASYTSGLFRSQLSAPDATNMPLFPHSDSLPLGNRLMGGSSYVYNQPSRSRNEGVNGFQAQAVASGYPGSGRGGRLRGRNLTQRFLLANEGGMTTMADLWVDAAMTETAFQQELASPEDTSPSRSMLAPSIFDHTGLRRQNRLKMAGREGGIRAGDTGRRDLGSSDIPDQSQSRPLWTQLPVTVILQYGCLALHSTTHDQVFLSYLVSSYDSGGLGLSAAHFAQLIALMCLAQIAYQFYLYPNFGPPRGRFSHLAMFRLGAALFVPAYLSVIMYRAFVKPSSDSNAFVMLLLALSTAIRFCGSTFAYTSIAILLNYLSPPQVNGLANGVAQSIVSLARFIGPILGGYIWSASIENGPNGYFWSFVIVTSICVIAMALSFTIR